MKRSILHFFLVVLFLLLPGLAFAEEPMPPTTDPAPPSPPPTWGGKEGGRGAMKFKAGEIIVKLREGISQAGVQSLLLIEDVSIVDEMDNLGLMLLSVPQGRELEKIEELKRSPLVEYAEPNYVVRIADPIAIVPHYSLHAPDVTPNDPRYPSQWNLPKIEAPAAWDITTGSEKVVIAFVDSGVDFAHPELKDKIWTNPGEIPGNGIDDDGNGKIDDVHGWDFVNWDNEPQDDFWLGTFMSSIAAAVTNNITGMAGVSWGAQIMPVKVYNAQGRAYISHITGGIRYAADNGARIINLSFNWDDPAWSQALQTAVDHAYSEGCLLVAAAGDSFDSTYQYPASLEHVVSVAATDSEDRHPDSSTYNDKVDVAAPGVYILGISSPLGFEYGRLSSTYAAAPHVSGLAALVWSVNPTLTNDEIAGAGMESIIESTAVDLGDPGRDDKFGYGRIDAGAAVMTTTHYLEVEPDSLLPFLVCDGSNPSSQMITNPNTNSSTWIATAAVPWLSIPDPEGYTPSWVTVSINEGGLTGYGTYTAPITVTSIVTNHVNNPKTITATAIYAQCLRNYLPFIFRNYSP